MAKKQSFKQRHTTVNLDSIHISPKRQFEQAKSLEINDSVQSFNLNTESLVEKFNREEINKEFRKKIKKYYLFKVNRTPCIQDLEEFITFNTDLNNEDLSSLADKDKDNLIYYKNKYRLLRLLRISCFVFWLLCFATDLLYFFVIRP